MQQPGAVLHKHIPELNFTVVANPKDYSVEFTVYDIVGYSQEDAPLWGKSGATHFDPVDTLEASEPYLHGAVKWDGCSNWYFDEQDRVMLHGCSREDVQRFGDVMALCWDWTKELLPNSNS